jgi:hypothetical protein
MLFSFKAWRRRDSRSGETRTTDGERRLTGSDVLLLFSQLDRLDPLLHSAGRLDAFQILPLVEAHEFLAIYHDSAREGEMEASREETKGR